MKIKKLIGVFALCLVILSSCHKDLGDYEINMPATPEVTNLDSVYSAVVGDSLIIKPTISKVAGDDIELQWRISVMTGNDVKFTGSALKIIFGLEAKRYSARLTVINKTNGMKYFHDFYVDGGTEFGSGSAVLSLENGVSQFSFIKPDGEVQARLYRAIQGKDLPNNPQSLHLMKNRMNFNPTILGYWIITKNGGVRLDANTMMEEPKYPKTISDNFFAAPENLVVGELKQHYQGILAGVINESLTYGTTNTWDQSPTYGMFSSADGEYKLAPSFIMNFNQNSGTYFIGFERELKQFVRINVYNGPTYFGTQYDGSTDIFDPKNVGMDLVHMEQLNGTDCFAYCKNSDGKIYELAFNVEFRGPFTFKPLHKRLFIRQELISENTKWQGAKNGVIYIASGAKVFRYNPINQDIRELATDFGGKTISMIKLSENEEQLMVGTEGTVWYTNITTGQNGSFIKKIEGIPGNPIDIAIR